MPGTAEINNDDDTDLSIVVGRAVFLLLLGGNVGLYTVLGDTIDGCASPSSPSSEFYSYSTRLRSDGISSSYTVVHLYFILCFDFNVDLVWLCSYTGGDGIPIFLLCFSFETCKIDIKYNITIAIILWDLCVD